MSQNRIFRVFLSSTFEDFQTERELLRSRVWPELESFCRARGATFEAIDLRWGIPANSAEDLDIVAICLDEVERCQKLSPRPNFIAMIGDRYGWRPLPVNIPNNVYEMLPFEGKQIIKKHYNLDENAIPETWVLNKNTIDGPSQENELLISVRNSIQTRNLSPELENVFFKSATHLEIDQGIFDTNLKDQEDHFFACFREIREFNEDNEYSKIDGFSKKFIDVSARKMHERDKDALQWLNRLKNDIKVKLKDKPGQLENYTTSLKDLEKGEVLPYMENFCLDIETWLKSMIIRELEQLDAIDPLELERLEHKKFRDVRTQTFGGREQLLDDIKKSFGNSSGQHIICLHGEGGSGKSALMSRLISDTEKKENKSDIVYRFIGSTPASVDLNSLMEGLVNEINRAQDITTDKKPTTRDEHVAAFQDCLKRNQNRKTFVFIDALDQLNNTENALSLYWLPGEIDKDVVLVVSVLNGDVFDSLRKIYPEAIYFDLSPGKIDLQRSESVKMLNALLSRKPSRTLQPFQVDYILSGFNKNPLMLNLKLIAENARHWHSFDSIQDIEKKNLGVRKHVNQQIELLFERLSSEDNHGPVFIKKVLASIALSREGASDREIQEMLWLDSDFRSEFDRRKHINQPDVNSLPPIIWSRFFFDIEPFVMERSSGGTIVLDFFHRHFKDVVKSGISESETKKIHELFASYFGNDELQPVRYTAEGGGIIYNHRKLTELPFHQLRAGLTQNAYKTLTNYVFVDSKVKTGKVYELMEDMNEMVDLDVRQDYPLLSLISKALRNEINFIARHPESFFQSIYNSCWWHDHPLLEDFTADPTDKTNIIKNNLHTLMEEWERMKSALEPGFYWLKALQPPPVELDGPLTGSLRGLSSPVIYTTYSADGKKIHAVCNRGELITWNTHTLDIDQFVPFPHEKSFMFKPNSKKKFTGKTEIKSEAGGVLADHPGFEYWAWSGMISDDGKLFISGSFNGKVTLYEFTDQGSQSFDLILEHMPLSDPGVKRPVRGIAFSGNKKFAATGHADGSVVLWDIKTRHSVSMLQHKDGWVNSVAIDRDCKRIISGGGDGIVYFWYRNKENFELVELKGHSDRIWAVTISEDGRYAASGSDDKSVRIWDLDEKREIKTLKGHKRWIQALAFTKNMDLLASSGGDGKIMIWKVGGDSLKPHMILPGHDDSILYLNFSNDDKKLLSASRDQSIRIWDIYYGKEITNFTGHSDRITCAAFSKDCRFLFTGSNDKHVIMWDTGSGRPLKKSPDTGESVSAICVPGNNRSVVIGTDSGQIKIAGIRSFEIERSLNIHATRIYAIALSNNSKLAASASMDGRLLLWNLRTYEVLASKSFEDTSILSLSFMPDHKQLVAGTRGGGIIIIDLEQSKDQPYFLKINNEKQLFKAWVDDVVCAIDGKTIEARGGSWDDRKIQRFDAKTLEPVEDTTPLPDGAVGAFGEYTLGFGKTELTVRDHSGKKEIAWYPKALEFVALHPGKRQWAGVQRYNLHHFRLEGGM